MNVESSFGVRFDDEEIVEIRTANDIKNAVEKVIADCKIRTPDLGGDASTIDITKAIVKELI